MSSLFLEKAEWTKEPEGAEPAYVVFSGKLPSGEVFRHRAVALPVFLGRRHDPKDASLAPNYCFLGEGKPSKSISRKHATLSYNGKKQQYEMTCNGKNGFHIGRTEVQKDTVVEVKNGAAIRMGGARFYVLFPKEGTEVQETSGGKAASASVTAAAAASTKVKGNAKANAEGIKNEKKAKSAKGKGAHKDAGAKTSKAGKRKRNDKEVADGGNPKTKKKPRGGMHKMRKWIITAISARLLRQGEPGFTKYVRIHSFCHDWSRFSSSSSSSSSFSFFIFSFFSFFVFVLRTLPSLCIFMFYVLAYAEMKCRSPRLPSTYPPRLRDANAMQCNAMQCNAMQ